ADILASNRLPDGKAVPGMDECDVVDDEHARFLDRFEILNDAFGARQSVAAAVEGPRAAERAVPRTAARKLDRSGRIENPDEIFVAAGQKIAGGTQVV